MPLILKAAFGDLQNANESAKPSAIFYTYL